MVALTIEAFSEDRRATGSMLALMLMDCGTVLGAPVLGTIAHGLGFPLVYISVGTCCMVSACLYASAGRYHRRNDTGRATSVYPQEHGGLVRM
jgi:hypothetical protein